jgi:hypothetical protein
MTPSDGSKCAQSSLNSDGALHRHHLVCILTASFQAHLCKMRHEAHRICVYLWIRFA